MRRGVECGLVALASLASGCGGAGTLQTAPRPAPSSPSRAATRVARARHRHRHRHPAIAARAIAVQSGGPPRRRIALTFDADMTPQMRARIVAGLAPEQVDRPLLETLRRTRTPATLFLTGMWAQRYPREVRALAASPLFELGNHTWDHRAWTLRCYGLPAVLSAADKRAEVQRTAHILVRLTGRAPVWFRLPGLCHDDGDLRIAARAGEQTVDGLPSGDAFQASAAVIVRTVLGEVRPGSIIVMHMMGPPNAPATGAAVKALIPELRARGYRFVRLSQLLGR